MATRTRTRAGTMSDAAGYSGGVIPADGDTLDLAAFNVIADYSLTGTGLTLANTGAADANFVIGSGNVSINVAGTGTLTHKVIVGLTPAYLENVDNTQANVQARGIA